MNHNKRFLRVVRTSHSSSCDYVHATYGEGLEELGNGSFANVFSHPTDDTKVIKATTGHDRAYIKYVRNIMRLRKHSPWLPRIHDAYLVMSEERVKENYAARNEWYTSAYARRASVWLVVILDKLAIEPPRYTLAEEAQLKAYRDLSGGALDVRHSGRGTCGLTRLLGHRGISPTRIDKVAEALLNRMLRKYKAVPDMHEANALWQGGQLVLTDPFCGW